MCKVKEQWGSGVVTSVDRMAKDMEQDPFHDSVTGNDEIQLCRSASQAGAGLYCKQSEDDLLFSSLIDGAMFPIVIVSVATGAVLYLNKYAHNYFGVGDRSFEHMLAHNFWEDADSRKQFVKKVLLEQQVKDFLAVLLTARNKRRHVFLSSRLIEYKTQKAIYSVFTDVTEHIEIQKASEQSECRFRMLANNISDVLWIADIDLNPIYVTPSIEAFSGYTSSEFIRIPFITHMTPKYQRRFNGLLRTITSGVQNKRGLAAQYFEFECRRKNGTIVWVEIASSAMWDESGRLKGFTGMIRDSTKRVQKQVDLKNAKNNAIAASETKSEFLANMSHEIRTPMNGVLGILQLLQETELSTLQEKYVGIALGAGNSLLKIISDILDFSKIEAGKIECNKAPVSLRPLISSVMASFETIVNKDNVQLTSTIDPLVPETIMACGSRLKQVLFNLIGNAVKFTSIGSVDLQVIVVPTEDTNDICIQFVVMDTGVGISQSMQRRLFQPFSQEDGSFRGKYGGTGLGLSIVKNLVEMMGGEATLTSKMGEGTEVSFSIIAHVLELKDQREKRPVQERIRSNVAGASVGNVLVVEDEQINAMVISAMLKSLGFGVVHAPDGLQAIELLKSDTFACVFMDIQMPEMDGVETTTEIRQSLTNSNVAIPIIALTAHAMKGDREQFIAAGMNDYLAKPVEVEQLKRVLKRIGLSQLEK